MPSNMWKALQNGSDIRGVALPGVECEPVNLTEHVATAIGEAFALWLASRKGVQPSGLRISVGHDSRLSADSLEKALTAGIARQGAEVCLFGLASTPGMFMSTVTHGWCFDGAVMITASHLPANRNGFKFFTSGGGLEKADITAILDLAEKAPHPASAAPGKVSAADFMPVYAASLVETIRKRAADPVHPDEPLKGLRIVVDAGNGGGGFFVDNVLKPLGADTTGSQFLEPDGAFPNHVPNPENEQAMEAITRAVIDNNADLGIIFDTDVDRAGAVDKNGREINRNRLIALLAAIILEDHPGTTIVTDSITSDELAAFIESHGGIHHRFKRGYRNVINEAMRLNSEGQDSQLAIETSGHGALKENYFLDDGAYLVARILIKVAQLHREGKTVDSLLDTLSEPLEAYEIRLKITAADFRSVGETALAAVRARAESDPGWLVVPRNYEGIRVSFPKGAGDGWFLIRLSLHDPILPVNVESREAGGCRMMMRELLSAIRDVAGLDLSPLEHFLQ
jgi:phosphomannomutase